MGTCHNKGSRTYVTKGRNAQGGRGSSSGKEAKVIGKVKMGNGTQQVYNKMPEGWKVQEAQTTPFGYIFVTNGVSIFQNLRGENKGKRKTGLIKDSFLWNDKSKSVQNRISPIIK